jgi:hypothetical protein
MRIPQNKTLTKRAFRKLLNLQGMFDSKFDDEQQGAEKEKRQRAAALQANRNISCDED